MYAGFFIEYFIYVSQSYSTMHMWLLFFVSRRDDAIGFLPPYRRVMAVAELETLLWPNSPTTVDGMVEEDENGSNRLCKKGDAAM